MEDKKRSESNLSLSKERKLARKKEIVQMKRNARISKLVTICVASLVCLGIASLIGLTVYRNMVSVKPSDDYSGHLDDNGFIQGVTATTHVDLGDYKNILVPADEVEYTEEQLNTDIKDLLAGYATLEKNTTAAIVDGDKVNIDFVGKVDGEEFEGGSTDGSGYDLTIGSGSFIDDFEEQLIGHKVGENVTVEVDFPADYQTTELAGKPASFSVIINGIYVAPEFTDAFVKENLSEYASNVEDYKTYLKVSNYDEFLTQWLEEYILDNAKVSSYPKDYTDHIKSLQKYLDMDFYEYMNAYYSSNFGFAAYQNFRDYLNKSLNQTELEYDKSLVASAKEEVKEKLVYQAILESESLTVTEDEYVKMLESQGKEKKDYDAEVEQYGKGYVLQQMVKTKALDQLKTYVTVDKQ